ncbi:MAG: methyltransferase family protein [Bacillota bacterium]
MKETLMSHFGQWGAVLFFIIIYGIALAFVPFYKKSQRKPASAYMAFVVAYAFEMHGIPASMYIFAWLFGFTLPEGVLWGHTLINYIGHLGMYIGAALAIGGITLVIYGWNSIYRNYWSKEEGKGKMVTQGIYRYIRHPQYTGFMLISTGMIFTWATIPTVIMWPVMAVMYYRLAKREEMDMQKEFGSAYIEYKKYTKMFIPGII